MACFENLIVMQGSKRLHNEMLDLDHQNKKVFARRTQWRVLDCGAISPFIGHHTILLRQLCITIGNDKRKFRQPGSLAVSSKLA